MENNKENKLNVSGAIIIAGIIIALAIFGSSALKKNKDGKNVPEEKIADVAQNLDVKITKDDHILGNKDAKLKLVIYTDIECPFCKRFHDTVKKLNQAYPNDLALIVRHFPLDGLHQNSRKEAEATECAFGLGGNEAFWKYLAKIFETTPSNDGLDLSKLPEIAVSLGLNQADFEKCLASGKYVEKVEAMVQQGIKDGAEGTPYSIFINAKNKQEVISGAQPFENIKAIIDANL